MTVAEQTAEIGGVPVLWRSAPTDGTPILYVHGVPTSSFIWLPFLERAGGLAPDLPGFGRSAKPANWNYSIAGYDGFVEAFLDHLGVDRLRLVVQDWGGAALAYAQRRPERIERLVIMDAVPLLPGYRWHRIARAWRTRVLGELAMGMTTKRVMRMALREATGTRAPMPDDFVDSVWRHFDHGTQRAILRLYRNAPEDVLAKAGERLEAITAPTLVLWGERDPYMSVRFADEYAARLPSASVRRLPNTGHWPWLEDHSVVDEVVRFLTGPDAGMRTQARESE